MGQSNMSGRGGVEPADRQPHPRVFMFTSEGDWVPAVEPVTHDRPELLGVGPGLAFGKALADAEPTEVLGLIPCSIGGTPLSRWEKGADLYERAVHRARLARAYGTVCGVLWHQGESDSKPGLAESYGMRLSHMIRELRKDLQMPELPFVAGELGEFLYNRALDNVPEAKTVNSALARVAQELSHVVVVSSAGLGHKGDQLHFDTAAQRELGRRYAAAILSLRQLTQTRRGY